MKPSADKEQQLYREVMGKEAAERQIELAKKVCSHCGGRDGRHHQMCKRRKA